MDYKNYNPRAAALAQARTLLTDAVKAAVADGTLPEAALPDFIVEIPADVKNGDIASNVAMAGARAFHKAPRQIAEAITAKLQLDGSLFDRFEVAGPGFINLFLGQDWFTSVVRAAVANLNMAAPTRAQARSITSSSSPPTPPAPCTWATPAAAHWATAWPPAWTGPATM